MYQNQENYGDQQGQHDTFSWVCPKCQTINNAAYCCCCGYKRKVPKPQKEKNPWKIVSIVLIVLLAFMVIGLFSGGDSETEDVPAKVSNESAQETSAPVLTAAATESACQKGHDFAAATCETPKTCKDCGETEGDPLGHDYLGATCTDPARCTRCLKSDGKTLSHDWQPASYDSPETCSLCAETRGTVKGYYETLPGHWTETRVSVGGCDTTPWVFDDKVNNCVKFTMYFEITDVDFGKVTGKHTLYTKENGKWKKLSTFNVSDESAVEKTFEFKDPIDITQLAVVPPYRSSYSYSFRLGFYDWYLRD